MEHCRVQSSLRRQQQQISFIEAVGCAYMILSLTSITGGIYYNYYVSVWKHYVSILLFGGKSRLKEIKKLLKSDRER